MSLLATRCSDSSVGSDSGKAPGVSDKVTGLLRTRNFDKIGGFGQQLEVKRTFLHAPRKHWNDDGDGKPLRRRSSSFSEGCASEHDQCIQKVVAISGMDSDMASMSTEGSLADYDLQVQEECWPNMLEARLEETEEYQQGYMFGCLEMKATRLHAEALQMQAEAFRVRAAAFEAKARSMRAAAQKEQTAANKNPQDLGAGTFTAKNATETEPIANPATPRPAEEGEAKSALDKQSHWKCALVDKTLSTASFENWPTLGAACKTNKKQATRC